MTLCTTPGDETVLLFEKYKKHNRILELDEINDLILNLSDHELDVESYCSFNKNYYTRNKIFRCEHFEVLILCWLNGQRSKIHDHQGTNCGVKVFHGEATETYFSLPSNGNVYPTHSSRLKEGGITLTQDDGIHQISNLQDQNQKLITLHVYSPPLKQYNVYSIDGQPTRKADQQNAWFYHI